MILNTLDDCTLTCQDDNVSEHHLDDTAIALELLHRPKKTTCERKLYKLCLVTCYFFEILLIIHKVRLGNRIGWLHNMPNTCFSCCRVL